MHRRLVLALLGWFVALGLPFGAALTAPPAHASTSDEPILILTPNQAPCGTAVIARGSAFPAGRIVEFAVAGNTKPAPPGGVPPPTATVAADGTFALALVPCVAATPGADGEGAQYIVAASTPLTDPNDPFARPEAYARAIFTVGTVAQRPTPTLTLTPEEGSCNGPTIASGANWFPGDVLALTAFAVGSGQGVGFAQVMVGADGAFSLTLELHRATRCTTEYAPPLGTRYRISVGPDLKRVSSRHDSAAAIYTVTQERLTERCFAATGFCVRGSFFDRWERHGLAGNGYPLSDEFDQVLEDGKVYTVQYFERVRLERHPENAPPHDILLGQFGRRIVATVPDAPVAAVAPQADTPHFAETGHNVDARFMEYWQFNGGLEQFGFPLTEAFEQRLEDGNSYRVQYFERARFEHHPGNQAPYDVLLGQFGRRILGVGATRTLALDPPSGPCPDVRTSIVTRGADFAPGVVTRSTIRRDRDGEVTGGNSTSGGRPTNAGGNYETTIGLSGCGPAEPPGSTFTITVTEYRLERTPINGPGTSAVFTATR